LFIKFGHRWLANRRNGFGNFSAARLDASSHDPCLGWHPVPALPVVNIGLMVANVAVFLFFELPSGEAAGNQAAF
jgi:hypothetical protein